MAEPTDAYRLTGAVLEGRYRIEQVVARGGFGVVYRGVQLALDRQVAVKVLRVPEGLTEAQAADVYALFDREGRTTARLAHPAIVQTIDQGVSMMPTEQMAPWMVLEWLTGNTLRDHLREQGGGPYSPAAALTLLRPVMDALAHAHEHGVAHRDIKPSNIMAVASRGGRVTLRLMDFGIAKLMEDGERAGSGGTRTAAGFSPFSPEYASPEQVGATHSGPWTDVHAMGLIFTELLVGGRPYLTSASDRIRWLTEVMSDVRPTPGRHGVDAGPWESVLARAMHRRPSERYPNAGEFLAALESTAPTAVTPARTPTDPTGPQSAPPSGGGTVPIYQHPESGVQTHLTTSPPSYVHPQSVATVLAPIQAQHPPMAAVAAPVPSQRRGTLAIVLGALLLLVGAGVGAFIAHSARTTASATPPAPAPPTTVLALPTPPPAPTPAAPAAAVVAAPTSPQAPTSAVADPAPPPPAAATPEPRLPPAPAAATPVPSAPATGTPAAPAPLVPARVPTAPHAPHHSAIPVI